MTTKKIDSVHDLTRGDKAYLKGHGISAEQFDKMDETSKQEWKDECKVTSYGESYSRNEAVGAIKFFGGTPKFKKKKQPNNGCNHQFKTSSGGGIIDGCIHCGISYKLI